MTSAFYIIFWSIKESILGMVNLALILLMFECELIQFPTVGLPQPQQTY